VSAIDLLGYAAAVAVFATFWMNTMLPLRVLALASNLLFILYGYFGGLHPVLVLHAALLPVNLIRLGQIWRVVRDIRMAESGQIPIDKLLPYMKRRDAKAGEILFRKGDAADRFFYVAKGSIRIVELDLVREAGAVVGEIGIFAPDHKRMATVECRSDCELFELSETRAKELYFQDPSFGYAVLRLITSRLLENYQQALKTSQG
jgi:hypothetical protein